MLPALLLAALVLSAESRPEESCVYSDLLLPMADLQLADVPEHESVVLRGSTGVELHLHRRLAGGVFDMSWDGQTFIEPLLGNGGSMQSACSLDIRPGHSAEERNPTEAGCIHDNGGATSSALLALRASPCRRHAHTRTRMAFFIPPGQTVHCGCPAAPEASSRLSDVHLTKRVSVGAPAPAAAGPPGPGRVLSNVVDYAVTYHVPPGRHFFCQFEALTGYMPRSAFTAIWVWDFSARRLRRHEGGRYSSAGERVLGSPVAVATPSGSHALGVWCAEWPAAPPGFPPEVDHPPWYTVDAQTQGGHDLGARPVDLTKWNVVWHAGDQAAPAEAHIPGGEYSFRFLLPVGTLADVEAALRELLPGAA